MFQELDTPPSRCGWRCGCAMSCVGLVTADIDQVFGACSSSAVLPAWRRISQTYESRFSSNSILVRRGRRELCKPGSSQSFGRGWPSFTTPVLAQAFVQFHVGNVGVHGMADPGYSNCGVMSSATVAVVFGAAELGCLGQHEEHLRLVFHFWERAVRSRISWKRCVDDVLVGSRVFCRSCIFVFVRACYQIPISLVSGASTAVHTWVDVLRVVGQHVAVHIKNPNRSWVHDRGPQQKSTFLPWTGVLEGGMGSIRGRCAGSFGKNQDVGATRTVWCGSSPGRCCGIGVWVIPCLSSGAWFTPCRAVVLPTLVAKLSERGFLIARIERCLTLKRITGRNLGTVAAGLIVIGRVAVEGQGIVAQLGRALLCPPALFRRRRGGRMGRVRAALKFLKKV